MEDIAVDIIWLAIAFCAGFVVAIVAGIWKDSNGDKK